MVYNLKFVGPLEFKLVVPMPEQIKTTPIHFYEVSALRNMNFGLIFPHCHVTCTLKNVYLA